MKTFHVDEPSEIGKKKQRISPKDKMMIKKDMSEKLNITSEQAKIILWGNQIQLLNHELGNVHGIGNVRKTMYA